MIQHASNKQHLKIGYPALKCSKEIGCFRSCSSLAVLYYPFVIFFFFLCGFLFCFVCLFLGLFLVGFFFFVLFCFSLF